MIHKRPTRKAPKTTGRLDKQRGDRRDVTQRFTAAIVSSDVDPELHRTNTDITPSGLWLTHTWHSLKN